MKFIGNLIIYFALFILFMASGLNGMQDFSFGGFAIALAVAFPLFMLGTWFVGMGGKEEQAEIDAEANALVGNLAETKERFFLYLRPFSSTNQFRLSDDHLNLFSWELWERDGFDDIERIVARALKPTAKFIALGKPGEHRGAARIVSEDTDWQDKVRLLVDSALLVIVMPSHHAGTLWELGLLKAGGHMGKTIFIAPPTDSSVYKSQSPHVMRDWGQTVEACHDIDLFLPAAQKQGALFRMAPDGSAFCVTPFPHPDPVDWMEAIQSLINS